MLNLHKVSPGETITADWANALVDAVLGLGRIVGVPPVQVQHSELGTQISVAGLPRFDLVELKDTLEANDTDRQASQFSFDPSGADKWIDANRTLEHTADPQHGLYLAGERHLTYFHPAAGQRIPIPGVQWHLGKLAADLTAGGSVSVKIYKLSSGSLVDSGLMVTAYDWLLPPGFKILSGHTVYVLQHLQSKRWFIVPRETPPTYANCTFTGTATPSGFPVSPALTLVSGNMAIGGAGSNQIVCPYDGIYEAIACITFGYDGATFDSPTGRSDIKSLQIDAGPTEAIWTSGPTPNSAATSGQFPANAGDTFAVFAFISAVNSSMGVYGTFNVRWLGPKT